MSDTPSTYRQTGASGVGLATLTSAGTVLDVWFPEPRLGEFQAAETFAIEGPPATDAPFFRASR